MLPLTPLYTQARGAGGGDDNDDLGPIATYAVLATVLFTLVVFLFETYLALRQRASFFQTDFPRELRAAVDSIDAERAREQQEGPKEEEEGAAEEKKDDHKENKGEDETKSAAAPELTTPTEEGDDDDGGAKAKAKVDRNAPLLPQLRAKFEAAQSYGLDKSNFSLFSSAYGVVEGVAFLLLGFMPWIWDVSCDLGRSYFGWTEAENEIKISLVFLLLTTLIGTVTGLPFELYSTFRIEKKHGFNKQTMGLFFGDKVKGLGLTCVFGGPFVALLLKIIKWGGDAFYLYVWAFTCVFSVLMMTLVPIVIMPMFNKYEKLPEGDLKDKIYAMAGKLEFPLTNLFVMDGSKRSSHSNAFMFGFLKNKRIVLFDTLLTQVHDDEILAILGHELGHWKMGHTVTNFLVSQLYLGAAFYVFSLCYGSSELYRAFGFDGEGRPVPTIVALLLFFSTVWEPIDKPFSYAMTVHSRKCEFEADGFGVNLGMSKKLQSGLCKIHLENLGAMCPDPWYSSYHFSHPPLVERLSAMMRLDKKTK